MSAATGSPRVTLSAPLRFTWPLAGPFGAALVASMMLMLLR